MTGKVFIPLKRWPFPSCFVRLKTPLTTFNMSDNTNSPISARSLHSDHDITSIEGAPTRLLWRLYVSHTLSTWNARTFEFGAVIFLATIFPQTLFYTSLYALFRSAAAAILSSWLGGLVDRTHRLTTVRQSIVWQRLSVAISCLLLQALLQGDSSRPITLSLFLSSVALACLEKLAFIVNTVSVERDWVIVISESLKLERQDLNSAMRRIDLVCKLVAPLCVSLVDSYSTKLAIWFVFGQNALSVIFEYFAIAQVFSAIPELGHRKDSHNDNDISTSAYPSQDHATSQALNLSFFHPTLTPWKEYILNPAFLASFSLSLLYLTVLSFASQMTTYLLSLGFTSFHVSVMRLVAVSLELTSTCAAPLLMRRIGPVRSGLWFINEQLIAVLLAIALFSTVEPRTKFAGAVLASGVALSRIGLWGFDLCVQFLVQEDAPEHSRGSFSAIEAALQNFFELISFAVTMIFHRPDQFGIAVFISVGALALSASCFAAFVRKKRGHLLHTSRCFKREGKPRYTVLPTIEEEVEDESESGDAS